MVNFWSKKDPSLESPVPHLLKTNDPPTELELSAITKAVADAQHEFEDILLGSDRARVARLSNFIRVHRAVLSPIRCVPAELLAIIFFYVFWDEEIDTRCPPFLLAHENARSCHYTSSFATHHFRSIFPEKTPRHRSCPNSPLSFYVLDHPEGDTHPALATLITRSTSWKCISLDLNVSSLLFLNENLMSTQIRHLTKLQLKVTSPFPFSSSAFQYAPALTDVEIESDQKISIKLPWKQLKSYRERSWFDNGASSALRYGVELVHFAYSTPNPSPSVIPPFLSTLPCLKVLDIKIYHEHHLFALQLKTPGLEELILRDHGLCSIERLLDYFRFSCGRVLKRLAFHVQYLKPGQLAQILQLLPNLEELECPNIPPEDLGRLACDGPPLLCPLLRRLIIHKPSDSAAIDNLINCRTQFQPTEHTSLFGSQKPGLDSVRLVFCDPETCDTAAVMLGIQERSPRDNLIHMRKAITQLELACKNGLAEMSSEQASGVNKALSKLETFAFKEPNEIDLRAVNILRRFWWHVPPEAKYKFSDRARTLLDIWNRTVCRKQTDRWIRDESNSLVYLNTIQEGGVYFLTPPWIDDRDKGFHNSWPYEFGQ